MAGAGYRLFNTGDVLTAAQVNTFLQEQVVMVFANATARTTALSGVLAEGMMSYLQDTNAVEVYNGSVWVSVGGAGDITEVTTAGNSGLTGGATSGAVALRINTSAKGSIIAGTGASTLGELTVGANNTVLTADSSTATGLKWAAAGGGSFNLISRQTFSNVATASFEGVLSSTYDSYIISIEKVYGSTGGADLLMTLLYSTNTEQTTDYYYNTVRVGSSNTNSAAGPASSWMLSDSSSANTNQAGHNYVYLTQVNNAGAPQFSGHGIGGDAFTSALFAGLNTTSRSYTGVRFKMHSGNIYADIAIYGLAKS